MTVDEIRELINLAAETGIAELEVQRGEDRVRIRRGPPAGAQEFVLAAPPHAAAAAAATAAPAIPAIQTTREREDASKAADANLVLVKSPIVGTFYECASPGAPPFVRIGRTRAARQGALHHRIDEAHERDRSRDVAGVIESKLVLNGQPVEYGEALFAIRAGLKRS